MNDVLSRKGRRALEELALSNVLLGFDYDGTLAPIVARPEQARMRRSTRTLLAEVGRRYPCAVVSGRARDDVARLLEPLPLLSIVGNHGIEWENAPPRVSRPAIVRWRRQLEAACAGLEGVRIEDKTWSLAVHWRGAARKSAARARVLAAAMALSGARVVLGKDVVNLVHPGAAHKGAALVEIRRRLGCDTAIYVGDDDTDEDVFALDAPGRLLAVRVGRSRRSHAQFYLADQARIDRLLEALLAFRPATSRPTAAGSPAPPDSTDRSSPGRPRSRRGPNPRTETDSPPRRGPAGKGPPGRKSG
jgi:trehalose 6-phosphate phosphatase